MAHMKITIVRKWYGKVPVDRHGNPIPKNLWPQRRRCSWEVRWYGSNGTRYSKSFKSRKEAQDHAEKQQVTVNNGVADKPQRITIEKFIGEHGKIMVGRVAPATLRDHLRALNMFAEHIGKDTPLERIRPQHAESFISQRMTSKAIATANKDIRILKSVFNMAIEPRGYLPEGTNPFTKIKQRKRADEPNRYVSGEDFKQLIENCPNLWWRMLLALAYTTGGRRDELLHLTWADVDFNAGTVRFVPKKTTDVLLEWEPKDHESRTIPIPERVVQLLADMQVVAEENHPYIFVSKSRLAHILARRSKGKWLPDGELINNLTRKLKAICARAKVPYCTLHDLRRSCITNWAKALPIQVVRQLAGHSSIETTRRFYLSVQHSDLEAARAIQANFVVSLTNF